MAYQKRFHLIQFSRLLAALALLFAAACSRSETRASETRDGTAKAAAAQGAALSSAPPAAHEQELVVFAAASLHDAFTALEKEFTHDHPDVNVVLNFAGTQELRTQLEQGAAVDVFAAADQKHIGELFMAGKVGTPQVFARNEPVIVVSQESKETIQSLADLPKADRLVFGVPEVPIGRYTLQILEHATTQYGADFKQRVETKVVSRELNVKQVLTKVNLGEAAAGIVYRTDTLNLASAGNASNLSVVTIPAELNVVAQYAIALVTAAPHPSLARAWCGTVMSEVGQKVLRDAGFLSPQPGIAGQ